MDVEVCAFAIRAEARPRRVQRLVVGEDLDPPLRRVADDLAAARRDEDSFTHEAEYAGLPGGEKSNASLLESGPCGCGERFG